MVPAMGKPKTLVGSDPDLGAFLVRKGILTQAQLEEVFQLQRQTAESAGVMPWLGDLLVQKGYLPDREKLKALGPESSAPLQCDTCVASFEVWYFNEASAYPCPSCGGALSRPPPAGPADELRQAVAKRQKILGALVAGCAVALAVFIFLLARPDPARPIVDRAYAHLEDEDWEALEADLLEIEEKSARHPAIPFFRQKLDRRKADQDRRLREWQEAVDALKSRSLEAGLRDLRVRVKESPGMKDAFLSGFRKALAEMDQAIVREGRALSEGGVPAPEWLEKDVKDRARLLRERARGILDLEKDPEFTYKSSPDLSALPERLQRIIDYRGTWELRVNVAPFAEVVVRRGTAELGRDWTPVVLRGIEVADGAARVDLYWPSRDAPRAQRGMDLSSLRNGQVVYIGGDLESDKVQVSR